MDRKKQDKIDQALRSLPLDKVSGSFTSNVMSDLKQLTQNEIVRDSRLAALLKTATHQAPKEGFVDSVMSKIEAQSSKEYRPIISKRGWLFVSATIAAIISFVLMRKVPTETTGLLAKASPYLERTQSVFDATQTSLQNFAQGFEISYLLAMSLLILSVLIFVDFVTKEQQYVS